MSELMGATSINFDDIVKWENLFQAWKQAAKGKRSKRAAATFEHNLADELLELQAELIAGTYKPGEYTHFYIHEPKCRKISAAPFRDRVVHHALCNIIEPDFERRFIPDSYANRVGKGTHKAVARFQQLSKQYCYVLRLDIVKHFPSLDHQILYEFLSKNIEDKRICNLIQTILDSGKGVPWLGFVIFPKYKRLKSRKVVHTSRHLTERYDAWQQGRISFGEFDACVQGWINHVRYADSWGLRKHVLKRFNR